MLICIVEFISDALFFVYTVFILSNRCYTFSLVRDNFIIIFWSKPNRIQYSFISINYFFFNAINETVVQVIFG